MGRDEEEQQHRGFKVEDRRRFSETGEARPEAPATPETPPAPQQPSAAPGAASNTEAPNFQMGPEGPQEALSFSSFIMGLITQALVYLGEIADPVTKQSVPDLAAARQMIDILGILQEKTQGNLDKSEAELLQGMLYDLRLRFVERTRR